MPETLPGFSDGVNPRPSYYAVIPASVRYCKGLPPAAKLLFGEITALCSVEGYCWASNAYFTELYDVDRSTLQRWLSALAAKGFIRVELQSGTGDRRIYDLTAVVDPPQKRDGGAAKMSGGGRKSEAQSITRINTKSNTGTLNVASDGGGARGAKPTREPQTSPERATGAASPLSVYALQSQKIDAVVALTGDSKSRKRFQQLLDVAEAAGCWSAWQQALDALTARQNASPGLVERPGAYFCSVLVSALNAHGVPVPVGSPSQRRSVRDAIRSSLAASTPVEGSEVGSK